MEPVNSLEARAIVTQTIATTPQFPPLEANRLRSLATNWSRCALDAFTKRAPSMDAQEIVAQFCEPTEKIIGFDSVDAVVYGAGPAGLCLATLLEARGKRVLVMEKRREWDQRDYVVWVAPQNVRRFSLGDAVEPVLIPPNKVPPNAILTTNGDNTAAGGIVRLCDLQKTFYNRLRDPENTVFAGVVIPPSKLSCVPKTIYDATGNKISGASRVANPQFGMTLVMRNSPTRPAQMLVRRHKETRYFFLNSSNTYYFGTKITRAAYEKSREAADDERALALNIVPEEVLRRHPDISCAVHLVRAAESKRIDEKTGWVRLGDARQTKDFFSGEGVNFALEQALSEAKRAS